MFLSFDSDSITAIKTQINVLTIDTKMKRQKKEKKKNTENTAHKICDKPETPLTPYIWLNSHAKLIATLQFIRYR